MNRVIGLGVVCVLALLAGGCGDQYAENTEEQLTNLKELNEVLATVTDEASLSRAIPRLEAVNDQIKENQEARARMGVPKEERRQELKTKYGARLQAELERLGANIQRIQTIPGFNKLMQAINDVQPGG